MTHPIQTGIEHALQNAVEKHIQGSMKMQFASLVAGRAMDKEDREQNLQEVQDEEETEIIASARETCEMMLRSAVEKIAGEGLANSIPPVQELMKLCRDNGCISPETALHTTVGFKAWSMSGLPENVTGLALENNNSGWIVLLKHEEGACNSICAAPWQNPDTALLPQNLELTLQEKGFDFVKNMVQQQIAAPKNTLSFQQLCTEITDSGEVPWLYYVGHSSLHFFEHGEGLRIRMCSGNGNAERLVDWADTAYPLLNAYNPQKLYENVPYSLSEKALQLDGGLVGPISSLLLRDLIARHKGYALQEAATHYNKACSALEERGCVPGMRGIYNDLDERMFTLRSDDGHSVLLGYENISHIHHPREFLLVGYYDIAAHGVRDDMPSRFCVYPVYPDSQDSGNMTARDMFDEQCGSSEVIEQLLWDSTTYSDADSNPPRYGIRDLVEAFKNGTLSAPSATLHTATGLVELDDPLDTVIPACWGVSTAIMWLCKGDKHVDGSACLERDERFDCPQPSVTVK